MYSAGSTDTIITDTVAMTTLSAATTIVVVGGQISLSYHAINWSEISPKAINHAS